MENQVNAKLSIFCPRKDCQFYQSKDNKVTKDGVYLTASDAQNRQMFYCHGGQHRFSETGFSNLFGNHGSFKEYEQTAKLNSYGLHTDQIADVLDKDPRTIEGWQNAIGVKSQSFHNFACTVIGIIIQFLQMDELWSYVKNKENQLWAFIGLESKTKFWVNFELGSRTTCTANRLVKNIKRLGVWGQCLLIVTTDKLAAYKNALEKHMHDTPYAYLQIVKRKFKRKLLTVKKLFVKGTESDFTKKTQNTSFIERLNLTLRQHISFLQRKTLGYCKSKANFNTVMWINLFNYNYIQHHRSLKVQTNNSDGKFQKKYDHYTPAMQIGLTRAALTWRLLLTYPVPSGY
jgi:IS1 family transposase